MRNGARSDDGTTRTAAAISPGSKPAWIDICALVTVVGSFGNRSFLRITSCPKTTGEHMPTAAKSEMASMRRATTERSAAIINTPKVREGESEICTTASKHASTNRGTRCPSEIWPREISWTFWGGTSLYAPDAKADSFLSETWGLNRGWAAGTYVSRVPTGKGSFALPAAQSRIRGAITSLMTILAHAATGMASKRP
jgi:hypothetical protein